MLTKLEFRKRFTDAEKIAIELASLDDPSAPVEQRQAQAMLRVYLADTEAATYVDVTDSGTVQGVQALAAFGLIQPSRVSEILAPVQGLTSADEVYALPVGYVLIKNPEIVVNKAGVYSPDQLVECCYIDDIAKTVAFSARYIVTGEI